MNEFISQLPDTRGLLRIQSATTTIIHAVTVAAAVFAPAISAS
jgi:hypothetical protein